MNPQKIFVVIPAFNEQPRLLPLLQSLNKYFSLSRVVVVDDGSEPPLKIGKKFPVRLLQHAINLGKGSAMRTGAEFAFSRGAEAVIFMDADLQHNPKEIPIFIGKLNQGYDMVLGSRTYSDMGPADRRIGNRLACIYIRWMFGVRVNDVLSGFRALTKKAYALVKWESDRYGVETEMIVRLSRHKKSLRWTEIPIETIYINKYKGISPTESVKILANSLWWKFS